MTGLRPLAGIAALWFATLSASTWREREEAARHAVPCRTRRRLRHLPRRDRPRMARLPAPRRLHQRRLHGRPRPRRSRSPPLLHGMPRPRGPGGERRRLRERHLRAGAVLAAPSAGGSQAPHPVVRTESLGAAACAACHEFRFPSGAGPRGFMQRTASEHARGSDGAGCGDCHLPRTGRTLTGATGSAGGTTKPSSRARWPSPRSAGPARPCGRPTLRRGA